MPIFRLAAISRNGQSRPVVLVEDRIIDVQDALTAHRISTPSAVYADCHARHSLSATVLYVATETARHWTSDYRHGTEVPGHYLPNLKE